MLAIISKKKAARKAFVLFTTPYIKSKNRQHPKDAELLMFKFNHLKIKGYRWNHPQPDKILILHGFGSAANKFERYATLLIKKGYEVLAFDAPAHGNSEGATINAIDYSEMIEKIMELYGPVQGFIAHSFGGIALSLALEKNKHHSNTKIVFIAPATETTTAIDHAFATLKITDTQVRKEFEKVVLEKSGKPAAWFSIRRAVKNIKAKILWIHDQDDAITPVDDALKVKQDNHSNIHFIITKGLGHKKIYHDANVKNKIVEFL